MSHEPRWNFYSAFVLKFKSLKALLLKKEWLAYCKIQQKASDGDTIRFCDIRQQTRESCCTGTHEGALYPLAHICPGWFYLRFISSCMSSSSVMSHHEPINLFTAQRTEKLTNKLVFTSCLLCLLDYKNTKIGNAGFSVPESSLRVFIKGAVFPRSLFMIG